MLPDITIGVLGDTHALSFSEIAPEVLDGLAGVDLLVHVGDYTNKSVLDSFRALCPDGFHGVHGNTDTREVRDGLPAREVIEVNGRTIAITHPVEGGPAEEVEELVMACFSPLKPDIIIYGHSHDARFEYRRGVFLFNPGRAYRPNSSFEPPASYGILTLGRHVSGRLVFI